MDTLRAIEGTNFFIDRREKLIVIERSGHSLHVPYNDLVRCLLWLSDRRFNEMEPRGASGLAAARVHG